MASKKNFIGDLAAALEAQGNPDNDIPTHIPTDGFYMKATNAKASQADRVGLYISGAFMPVKIMSDSEARQVIDKWNADSKHADLQVEYDFPRESGKVFNAETMQLEDEAETRFSVSAGDEITSVDEANRIVADLPRRWNIKEGFATFYAIDSEETLERFIKDMSLTEEEAEVLREDYYDEDVVGDGSADKDLVIIFTGKVSSKKALENVVAHEIFHVAYKYLEQGEHNRFNNAILDLFRKTRKGREAIDILQESLDPQEWATEMMAYFVGGQVGKHGWDDFISGNVVYVNEEINNFVARFKEIIIKEDDEENKEKSDESLRRGLRGTLSEERSGEVSAERQERLKEEARGQEGISFSTSEAVATLKDDERVYNDLLGKVFSGVSNETRRGIVEDAMRNRGNDFGAATEVWLGGLADDGKFADVDRRDWGRVKLALHQALMDNGVDVSEPLTDGESRYVLWKAGQIDDGVFSLAEDVVMQDRLLNGARAPQYTDSADVRFSASESEEDGIQFSVTPRDRAIACDRYERWMKSGRMQWLEYMQDSMLGLKKLMQAIMGNAWTKVEDVAMYENPYIAENLMSSVTAAQQQAFYTEFMKPLLEEVGKLCKGRKFDKKAFCDWAQAQDFPVFVSESVMPEGWVEIASESMKTINPKKNRVEKLWVQEKFAGAYEPAARNTGLGDAGLAARDAGLGASDAGLAARNTGLVASGAGLAARNTGLGASGAGLGAPLNT